MTQDIKLKLRNDSPLVTAMLHDFLNSNISTDVTLVSDDQGEFHAHKAVLSACSKTLKTILQDDGQTNSVIYFPESGNQEIGLLLQYMYQGEAIIDKEGVNEICELAQSLEIMGSIEKFTPISSHVIKNSSPKSVEKANNQDLTESTEKRMQSDSIQSSKCDDEVIEEQYRQKHYKANHREENLKENVFENSLPLERMQSDSMQSSKCDYEAIKEKYMQNHEESLQENVFENAYSQAVEMENGQIFEVIEKKEILPENYKRLGNVNNYPEWKTDLKENFVEWIINKCSLDTRVAWAQNEMITDQRKFAEVRSEIIRKVVNHVVDVYGTVSSPKIRTLESIVNDILGPGYPFMFRDATSIPSLGFGYGRGGLRGISNLPNNLWNDVYQKQSKLRKEMMHFSNDDDEVGNIGTWKKGRSRKPHKYGMQN